MQAKDDADRLTLFEGDDSFEIARACLIYALVPYLGILFVPVAFIAGGIGYITARRRRDAATENTALIVILTGAGILAVQVLLWWLLYYVPTLHRQY